MTEESANVPENAVENISDGLERASIQGTVPLVEQVGEEVSDGCQAARIELGDLALLVVGVEGARLGINVELATAAK